MVVPVPDEERFITVLAGAVGVGAANYRPIALVGLGKRTQPDRGLTLLCGAWAAWWLDPSADRSVASPELRLVAGRDGLRTLRENGWTETTSDGERHALRAERIAEATERLYERYATDRDTASAETSASNREPVTDSHEGNP